jgi:hypothetical protein
MIDQDEGTIRGLGLELWDDDGTAVFARAHATGPYVE